MEASDRTTNQPEAETQDAGASPVEPVENEEEASTATEASNEEPSPSAEATSSEEAEVPAEADTTDEGIQLDELFLSIATEIRTRSADSGRLTYVEDLNQFLEAPDAMDEPIDLGVMFAQEAYADIQSVAAPGGTVYLFSQSHIDVESAIAKSRAEEAKTAIAAQVRATSQETYKLTPLAAFAEAYPELEAGSELLAELEDDERYNDIQSIVSPNEATYLFSGLHISRTYATILARAEANDPVLTMVETVRDESRTYPRPTDVHIFREPVFKINFGALDELVERAITEHDDIEKVVASNGAVYLYSSQYLTEKRAADAAEWFEVGQHENP